MTQIMDQFFFIIIEMSRFQQIRRITHNKYDILKFRNISKILKYLIFCMKCIHEIYSR